MSASPSSLDSVAWCSPIVKSATFMVDNKLIQTTFSCNKCKVQVTIDQLWEDEDDVNEDDYICEICKLDRIIKEIEQKEKKNES
jgi:DNA-directed RNA polymerase subunit RPC12/RpoP